MDDASPDGGERVGGAHDERILRAAGGRDAGSDTWGPLSVAFVGFVAGLLIAVGLDLGRVSSLPVTLVAMAGGLVATGVRWLWTDDEASQPPGEPSSEGMGEVACDSETLLAARSLASLLDRRDVEVGDGRVTFRSRDGGWNLHLEPDAANGDDADR